MNYLALARKWRPQVFSQVVGQPHVVQALINAFSQQRMHHAYLFSGTRGVGKTTIARILAKALNCEQGAVAEPCGKCQSCIDIQEGRFVDLIEIDAASRTKVEDTREILENVQYRPTRGRFKVYLIDEVHMLSRHSFNALLKTLEEPPPHVKFLLATTDPQKLPVTILSRCLQFNLKSLSVDEIATHLGQLLQHEQVAFEAEALHELAVAARGSMRDGLSLTDQAIAFGGGSLEAEQVSRMLGTASRSTLLALLEALFAADEQRVFAQLQQIVSFSPDIDRLLSDLLSVLHQVAMMQFRPGAYAERRGSDAELLTLAKRLDPETVQLYYRILLEGRRELPWAPDTVAAIEMALLRCLAFYPDENTGPAPESNRTELRAAPASRASETAVKTVQTSPKASVQQVAGGTAGEPTGNGASVEAVKQPGVNPSPAPAADISDDEMDRELALQQEHLLAMAESQGFSPAAQETATAEAAVSPTSADRTAANAEPMGSSVPTAPATPPVASPATGAETPESNTGVEGVLKARHMLRSMRKPKGDGSAKKPEQVLTGKVAASPEPVPVADTVDMASHSSDRAIADVTTPEPAPSQQAHAAHRSEQHPAQAEQLLQPQQLAAEEVPAPAVTQPLALDADWYDIVQGSGWAGLNRQLAMHSVGRRSGNAVTLLLQPAQQHLNNQRQHQQLLHTLQQLLGPDATLTIGVGEDPHGETPFQRDQREYQERLVAARAELAADPAVIAMQQRFSAQIDEESVIPLTQRVS